MMVRGAGEIARRTKQNQTRRAKELDMKVTAKQGGLKQDEPTREVESAGY